MMKMILAASVLALGVAAPSMAVEQLVGGTFEAPVISTVPGNNAGRFVYPGGTFNGWTYQGGSGLINGVTGTPWFGSNPRSGYGGSQYAFVQNTGTLSQTFTANEDGRITLSWLEGSRPALSSFNGNQTYNILVNGSALGQFSTASGQNFVGESLFLGSFRAGESYTIAFKGLATTDSTVFLDNISAALTPGVVPEPASWAMLIIGFGLVGAASRRRRRTSVLA